MSTDLSHIKRALKIAETSTCRFQHGVVIAHGRKVLSVGVNTARNPVHLCSDPRTQASRHAEFNAIRLIKNVDTSDLTLYSARLMKDGSPGLSKPCSNCQTLIDYLGFKEVWYYDGTEWSQS